jgi:hypothetical protein
MTPPPRWSAPSPHPMGCPFSAARGHSCPQERPNTLRLRKRLWLANRPTSLRTSMSARGLGCGCAVLGSARLASPLPGWPSPARSTRRARQGQAICPSGGPFQFRSNSVAHPFHIRYTPVTHPRSSLACYGNPLASPPRFNRTVRHPIRASIHFTLFSYQIWISVPP